MDPRVLDIPAWRRWLIVHLLILPFRPRQSGEAYAKIWTDAGSPLLIHSRALLDKTRRRLPGDGVVVELAMRYGQPSIADALERLRRAGADRLIVFPLYPQYSSAATGSTLERVYRLAAQYWNTPSIQAIPPFYDHPGFIEACADAARPVIEDTDPELVFFSFHGLPERQVLKSDDSGAHCLRDSTCCERIGEANRNCYRAQCVATAKALADRLDIPAAKRVLCFQSRLGRTPWIRPYTDEVLAERARSGSRRAVILSPAFVADCLETLEELGIRGAETWNENGGEQLSLAPCINSSDRWVDAMLTIVGEHSRWLAEARPASDVLSRAGA
jgi:ferrochelatase